MRPVDLSDAREVPCELDGVGRVLQPSVHDLELRALQFDEGSVFLQLEAHPEESPRSCVVIFENAISVLFESDILQNVVMDLYFGRANAGLRDSVLQGAVRALHLDSDKVANVSVGVITPAAGPYCAVACTRMRVLIRNAQLHL